MEPNSASAHHDLGHVLSDQGKPEEAITEFREAVRIKPGLRRGPNDIGNVLKQQGKLEEAIAEYMIAIRLAPNKSDPHNGLGIALHKQGKHGRGYRRILQGDSAQSELRITPQ